MARVELREVTKRFDQMVAVDAVSQVIQDGEFFSLLGPSGCGKTTTLRMVAGFIEPTAGSILFDGRDVTNVPAHRRETGMVFQHYALFPHRTVLENVAFGLRMRKVPQDEIRRRVRDALALVELSGMEQRYPRQLSGGQQQRVALARVLVIEPKVLLLDEPLGALDKKLREQMQFELRRLQQKVGITTIYVTHDQEEALTLCDRIAVMKDGRIIQVGTPAEIYRQPASRFVADFIGSSNFLAGRVVGASGGEVEVETPTGWRLAASEAGRQRVQAGAPVFVAVRPERIRLSTEQPDLANRVHARLQGMKFIGDAILYQLTLEAGEQLTVKVPADRAAPQLEPGTTVWLGWRCEDSLLLTE